MNKTPRLSKSGIEYLDYQWGIFSGCRNWQNGICPIRNCWAKGIATRFSNIYPNGFEPTFYPEAIDSPKHLKKPSIIGVGWVGDVIGYSSPAVRITICDAIKSCPQHTFLLLTKNPEKLLEWDFPDNCWVGISATNNYTFLGDLQGIEAKVKFISFEPLLDWRDFPAQRKQLGFILQRIGIDWVILGAQTKPYKPPKREWVREIVDACVEAEIPYFLKDNLRKLFVDLDGGITKLRQEMPICQKPQ